MRRLIKRYMEQYRATITAHNAVVPEVGRDQR